MTTFLPRNPWKTTDHRLPAPRRLRRSIIHAQDTNEQAATRLHEAKVDNTFTNDRSVPWTSYDDDQLRARADTARMKQEAWYDGIVQQSRLYESITEDLVLRLHEEREQIRRRETEAYQQTLEHRRARLAAEAEQQQASQEQERRVREEAAETRRRELLAEEEQRVRDIAEAAEALRLQLEAEEEQRLWEVEEAERRRRERERDCAVCLDTFDMGNMIELSCRHWYCRTHLRGKETHLNATGAYPS